MDVKKIFSKYAIDGYPSTYIPKFMRNQTKQIAELVIEKLADSTSTLEILSRACGAGRILDELIRRNFNAHLYGEDISPEMIELAREVTDKDISYFIGNSEETPDEWVEKFDAVVIVNGITFMNQEKALESTYRLLKPNGLLVYNTLSESPDHDGMIRTAIFDSIVWPIFDLLSLKASPRQFIRNYTSLASNINHQKLVRDAQVEMMKQTNAPRSIQDYVLLLENLKFRISLPDTSSLT